MSAYLFCCGSDSGYTADKQASDKPSAPVAEAAVSSPSSADSTDLSRANIGTNVTAAPISCCD